MVDELLFSSPKALRTLEESGVRLPQTVPGPVYLEFEGITIDYIDLVRPSIIGLILVSARTNMGSKRRRRQSPPSPRATSRDRYPHLSASSFPLSQAEGDI